MHTENEKVQRPTYFILPVIEETKVKAVTKLTLDLHHRSTVFVVLNTNYIYTVSVQISLWGLSRLGSLQGYQTFIPPDLQTFFDPYKKLHSLY